MNGFHCDGCLWSRNLPGIITSATHFATTCMHCYCVGCIKHLVRQNQKGREDAQTFRCQIPNCSLMVQLNQIKKISPGVKEAEPLLGIGLPNFTTKIKSIQKAMRFQKENHVSYVKQMHGELERKIKSMKMLEAKIVKYTKQIKDLEAALKKSLADKELNSRQRYSPWHDTSQGSRQTWAAAKAHEGLLDFNKEPSDEKDATVVF